MQGFESNSVDSELLHFPNHLFNLEEQILQIFSGSGVKQGMWECFEV